MVFEHGCQERIDRAPILVLVGLLRTGINEHALAVEDRGGGQLGTALRDDMRLKRIGMYRGADYAGQLAVLIVDAASNEEFERAGDPIGQDVAHRPGLAVADFLEVLSVGDVQTDGVWIARSDDLSLRTDPMPRNDERVSAEICREKIVRLLGRIGTQADQRLADGPFLPAHVLHEIIERCGHAPGCAERFPLRFGPTAVIPGRVDSGLHH